MIIYRQTAFERRAAEMKDRTLTGAYRYKSMESILRNSLDRHPVESPSDIVPSGHHSIRGAAYLHGAGKLNEPMMDKLFSVSLHGMAEG
jgi:hypothetical protein